MEIFHEDARMLVHFDTPDPRGESSENIKVDAFACFRFEGDYDMKGNIRDVLYWFVDSI